MLGGKNKQPLGYTIVEVMIVLAVSSVMFLIAAVFVQGKQEKASFTSGVNDMASQVQDVIEQVADGRYSDIPLSCQGTTTTSTTDQISQNPNPSSGQGTNAGCVFLGKMFQFQANNDQTQYELFTMGATATEQLSLSSTSPLTLSNASCGAPGNICQFYWTGVAPIVSPAFNTDLTVQGTTPQSLNVVAASATDALTKGTVPNAFMIGFIQSPNATQDGSYQAGAQTIGMVYLELNPQPGGYDKATGASYINPGYLRFASAACLVLSDGTQYATIDIGSTGASSLSVNVIRNNSPTC